MSITKASIKHVSGLIICAGILVGCGGSSGDAPGQTPDPGNPNTTPTISNAAPTISGTPAAAVAQGAAYSFTPTAEDADGDPLTFSIANKPAWASFDEATGALTGTPVAAGDFADITITVSDGTDSTDLADFSIAVTATAVSNNAILSWTAPSTRTDASVLPLSEINGYRIYRGDSADSLAMIVEIDDGTVTDYTVNNLPVGTHYFAVTVYDTNNNESGYSEIQSKTIQ